MIEFCNVSLKYHYEKYPLFEDLTFSLGEGTNTVLCDMQSGKTSLCKIILGTLPPNSGDVLVCGEHLYPQKGKAPIPNVLYLPSVPTFFPNKTVQYNLAYPFKVRKQSNPQRVEELAAQFHLTEFLQKKVKKLNFRQKKLLSLARGLTVPRDVVLFDGFFDDNELCNEFSQQQILSLFNCKTKVIFTTLPHIAVGNTVVLDGKKCVFQGESGQAAQTVANLAWLARETEKIDCVDEERQ